MRTLIAIAALGPILAGCSEREDPVSTFKCETGTGYYTVIYDATTKAFNSLGNNGGISFCGRYGCQTTAHAVVVGEVINFRLDDDEYILDRGDGTLRYGDYRKALSEYQELKCKVVPNGTR